ncbi:MAG: hypothetical protein K2Q26_05345 [Bdellovibrionales bacterium]|nr:hypothetical protein [Bdellovibrionales bacterium]
MSEQLSHYVQKSAVPLMILLVVIAAGGIGFHFMNSKKSEKAEKLGSELFTIRKEYRTATEELAKTLPKPQEGKPQLEAPKPKKADAQKAYSALVEKLDGFVKANQGTLVAVEGGLLAAEMAQSYDDWNKGAEILNSSLKDFNDKGNFLYGTAYSELGHFYAKLDKCNEATQAWEKAMGSEPVAFLKPQLRLKLGVCFEKLSQWDRAEKMYQDIINETPATLTARTAKKFLFNLKLTKAKASNESKNAQNN